MTVDQLIAEHIKLRKWYDASRVESVAWLKSRVRWKTIAITWMRKYRAQQAELKRLRAFVAEKGVIFDSEMCDGDYRCLACFKRAYNEPKHVQHTPGCIVAEARQAQKEGAV